MLEVKLDDGSTVPIPRRELWDVRVQIMAEDSLGNDETKNGNDRSDRDEISVAEDGKGNGKGIEGLGKDDVKTGVYEGGFKSWECSVDLVRVLAAERSKRGEDDNLIACRKILEVRNILISSYI